jgi:uncharacterized caspase-like protein
MRELALLIFCVAALFAAPAAAQEEPRRVALVIGNRAYEAAAQLPNAENDARLIAQTLGRAGFGVIEPDLNLRQGDFRTRLSEFARQARDADVAVIYYAGHGVQIEGDNWLLPVDANASEPSDLPFVGIPMQLMLNALANARLRILILDACRDNPFPTIYGASSAPSGLGISSGDRYNFLGTLIMFAASPNAKALDGPAEGNSPYARSLERYLPEPGLELAYMPARVMEMTRSLTAQRQLPFNIPILNGERAYIVPPAQTRVGSRESPVDAATELALYQAAEGLARNGDCGPIRAHRQRFASGVTVALADALIASCSARTVVATTTSRALPENYIDTLVARNRAPLTRADFETAAARMGVEVETLQAVVGVESGSLGAFASDGRPVILFEPHIFSRRTNRAYDESHPNVSYRTWDGSRYPRTQEGRWTQLREAFALDPENALASTSWGRFQIMGFNHAAAGFASPSQYVSDLAQTEVQQLAAFEAFVRANNLLDELQRRDWEGFVGGYNGSGQVERYARLMRDAYDRLKTPPT